MASKYKGFVAWQKLSHLTRPLGRPCQQPVLLALPATIPPCLASNLLSSRPRSMSSRPSVERSGCSAGLCLLPAWPGPAFRFLDSALRAPLEMTRSWTFRFLDSDSGLCSKSQEAQSLEMSRAMLSGPMLFQSILFFYFSLSFCSAIVSSTICCNWYVATPNGLLIPLSDHSTMVLLWARHISSPMLGLSSSPLRSSSAALT